jgi:hypothetical protein
VLNQQHDFERYDLPRNDRLAETCRACKRMLIVLDKQAPTILLNHMNLSLHSATTFM